MEHDKQKRSMWSERLIQNFRDSEYRNAFVESSVKSILARQIRILREEHGLSQADLAARLGTKQSTVSRLENPENGSVTLNTLLNLTSIFDVSLKVEFSSHEDFMDRMANLSRDDLCVLPYDENRINENAAVNNSLCWSSVDGSNTKSIGTPLSERNNFFIVAPSTSGTKNPYPTASSNKGLSYGRTSGTPWAGPECNELN